MARYALIQIVHVMCMNAEDKMEISNLRPGATYTFYLAAGNALGYGTPVKFRVSTRRTSNLGEQLGEQWAVSRKRLDLAKCMVYHRIRYGVLIVNNRYSIELFDSTS